VLEAGLELIDDKKTMLIEKIKIVIIKMIHYNDELPQNKLLQIHQQSVGV